MPNLKKGYKMISSKLDRVIHWVNVALWGLLIFTFLVVLVTNIPGLAHYVGII